MKILVGFKATEDNEPVLEKAMEHAKESGGTVYLLCVLIGSDEDKLDKDEPVKKNIADAQAYFKSNNIPYETKLIFSRMFAGDSIVDYAKEIDADEIIIGVRKKSKVGKLLFGSTAQHVILAAHCPVLAVK